MLNTHLNILHLAKRDDRLKALLPQLLIQGICFFSIIEGQDNKKNPKLAINQGHKRIIQQAKNNGDPNVIIAEDDIVFSAPGAWQYFLSKIPEQYNLFCGLVYHGTVENGRIMRGMSGTHTLYSCHSNFYDTVLSLPDDAYIDRELGRIAHEHQYFVCDPYVCTQSGGYSDSLKRTLYYHEYLRGKILYGQ